MKDVYTTIRQSFKDITDAKGMLGKTVTVRAPGHDFDAGAPPNGKEVKLVAAFEGVGGEFFTGYPGEFSGTVAELVALDMENDPVDRGIYFAGLNAVLNRYELADECLSCLEEDKDKCAEHIVRQFKKNNGSVNCLLVGYQPHMAKALAAAFPLRILDLDPDLIGSTKEGVTIEDGAAAYQDATAWAEVIVCTGSALANGSIFDYIKLPKDVQFYGTSIAGVARMLQLRRICPFGRN